MRGAFAVVHTWPELRNAEYEVVQRIIAAAANVDRQVVVVDNNAKVLWCSPGLDSRVGATLAPATVDFVLSLHFESPKLLDAYSYYALWQPISFYYDFHYKSSTSKFSTHNDLLSCDSDIADAHALNLYGGLHRQPLLPLPKLFHGVPLPFIEPRITAESRLFYIGINWERVGRNKGRFHDTLVSLDQRGLTDIYGPELVFGVAPWAGFNTYRGELPFDGQSVKRAINQAGICLVLSSAAHKRDGIMSNRLFEALAGGAAVIATPNPLIDKYFRDVVYLVDEAKGEAHLGQMILEAMRDIRSDTQEATRRVVEGQRILRETCLLESSITHLFDGHADRLRHFEKTFLAAGHVTIILLDKHGVADLLLARMTELSRQCIVEIDLHVVCDQGVAPALADWAPRDAVQSVTIHKRVFEPVAHTFGGIVDRQESSGPAVAEILQGLATPYFAIMASNEILFKDHFASLSRALLDNEDSFAAVSGLLREERDGTARMLRSLVEPRPVSYDPILYVNGASIAGRFLFRSGLVDPQARYLFALLDGEEARFFQLAALLKGKVAQTSYSSCLVDETVPTPTRIPVEREEGQQQFIRDFFAGDVSWTSRVSREQRMPDFAQAEPKGTVVSWRPPVAATTTFELIQVNRFFSLQEGGDGVGFLTSGFSLPEADHVWICAERGQLDFKLPADVPAHEELEIVVVAYGRRSIETGREQHCLWIVNGLTCCYTRVEEAMVEHRIRVPRRVVADSPNVRIELMPDHLEPASTNADVSDSRLLSVAIRAIGVFTQSRHPVPVFDPGVMNGCGVGQRGAEALIRGFYETENDMTWIAGEDAEIRFRTVDAMPDPVLFLKVRGRESSAGDVQRIGLTLNGQSLGAWMAGGDDELVVPLRPTIRSTNYVIRLSLHHAEVTADYNGRVLDGRLLGLAIRSIGVFDGLTLAGSGEQ